MEPNANSPRRALIFKFGQIGDVVMAIPAVHELYRQGFLIDWVAGKAARPLLECYEWINVIPADDRAILRGSTRERVAHIASLWRKIALKRYDLCATLYYDRRFRLLALPVRARRKLMLDRGSRTTALLTGRHHASEYIRVLLGEADDCREQSAGLLRPDRLPASPLPEKNALRRIAIVPGGTSNVMGQQFLRRWPIENYVSIARSMVERGWEVVLIGGPDDDWVKPHFEGTNVVDCIDLLSLPEVISLCDRCDGVISHDTGPLHLAGLSEACLIAIFGPTDPGNFLPRRPFTTGIWGGQGFACRPCYDGRDFAPCRFNGCMHQVSPGLVLDELDKLLDARDRRVPSPWRVVSPEGSVELTAHPELVSLTPGRASVPGA